MPLEAIAVSTTSSDAPVVGTELNYTPLGSDVFEPEADNQNKKVRDNYGELLECLDSPFGSDEKLTLFAGKTGPVYLTCDGAWHIIVEKERLPIPPNRTDWHEMQQCIAYTLTGQDWSGANPPNTSYKRLNKAGRKQVWSYVIVSPEGTIVTAWSGKDGADWGGCVRFGFF